MKQAALIILSAIIIFTFNQCETTRESVDLVHYKDSIKINKYDESVSIFLEKGKEFNHPSFVIWKENMNGEYIETLFITKSYASGIFGYAAITDSTWDNKPGESIQPAALPYWTHKKGLIDNTVLVPVKDHPFVDAYTGATPTGNFRFDTNTAKESGLYRILFEVNQAWDWNKFWTNNKYPDSESYKHSAQPSLVYAVTIHNSTNEFHLNPIGHGDPKGESGNLYTNLSTLTSAKEIFNSITINKK